MPDRLATPVSLATWLSERERGAIRHWAMRVIGGEAVPLPCAVIAFAARHHLPLHEPQRAAHAILRTLTQIASAKETAP
jgi:hypothetical protein